MTFTGLSSNAAKKILDTCRQLTPSATELHTFPTTPDQIASLSSAGCMHCSAVTPLQRGAGAGPPAQPDSAEPLPMIQKWKHGRSTGLSSLGQVDILAYLYCSEVGSGPWTRRRIALYCYRLCSHSFYVPEWLLSSDAATANLTE